MRLPSARAVTVLCLAALALAAGVAGPAAGRPARTQPALAAAPAPAPAAPAPAPAPAEAAPPAEPAAAGGRARAPVAILMYHEINPGPNNLYVPPAELAAHLDYLQANGYHPITLAQMAEHFTAGAPLPPRPVVLTFDDGYASFYTNALPLLRRHGFPATLFVIAGMVGRPNYVTWDQVRELHRAGIEIGAHTVSHPSLPALDPARLQDEVLGSRQTLERELGGQPVPFFAYPAGRYNDQVLAAVRAAGYRGAVTTAPGAATAAQDPLLWQRVRVNQKVSPAALGALLRAALGE